MERHPRHPVSSVGQGAALIVAISALFLLSLLLTIPPALANDLAPAVDLDIAAGSPLDRALLELADKANMLLLSGSLAGYTAPQLKGTYPVSQALARLMGPTGLSYKIKGRTIYVFPSVQSSANQGGNDGPNRPSAARGWSSAPRWGMRQKAVTSCSTIV